MRASGPQQSEDLVRESADLRRKHEAAMLYIRRKVNQLLTVMGTAPLRPEELDDATLASLFVLGPDMARVEAEVNRLDNQALVRYYEDEWRRWN